MSDPALIVSAHAADPGGTLTVPSEGGEHAVEVVVLTVRGVVLGSSEEATLNLVLTAQAADDIGQDLIGAAGENLLAAERADEAPASDGTDSKENSQ